MVLPHAHGCCCRDCCCCFRFLQPPSKSLRTWQRRLLWALWEAG
jgi:hypothetical protein